ncbi:hypothetical protein WKW80_24125 [Variovorax humicola]|uniref:Uncharacterized protein n=1 Tax=Variovorax humicola TaxID=1769758 RepID=A0ABU8W652_9BURK
MTDLLSMPNDKHRNNQGDHEDKARKVSAPRSRSEILSNMPLQFNRLLHAGASGELVIIVIIVIGAAHQTSRGRQQGATPIWSRPTSLQNPGTAYARRI